MKITDVKPYAITYGFRGMFLVKIETDAGLHGWGEGGISGKEQAQAAAVESLRHLLLGADPRRIDHLWQMMARGGFFEGGLILGGAISAVDTALWDILGKHLGVPVWQLLGGRSRDRIECYTHANLENAARKVADGWRYLRLEVGPPRDRPREFDPNQAARVVIERMHQAREQLGDEVHLCIDLHTRFNPPAAATACNGIADMRPLFVEDPLRSVSPKSYVAFRKRTSVPLAVGEGCANKWDFQMLIEEDAIDYARVDLSNVGGLTEARKVAAMAEAHYIDLVPHNATGPIANAAGVHLAAAVPNFLVLETAVGLDLAPGLFASSLLFRAPFFEIPTEPGLGIDVNESRLAEYPWKPWELATLHRPDGSLNNW